MADGRMIKKKASTDERLAQLSDRSLILYLLSIAHLDVDGRMEGLPSVVLGTVVPYVAAARPDAWTVEHVEGYITEWTRTTGTDGLLRPLVLWYSVNGRWALHFNGFAKNQRVNRERERPSVLPPPPPELLADQPRAVAGPDAVPAVSASGADQMRLPVPSGFPAAVPAFHLQTEHSGVPPDLLRAKAEAEEEGEATTDQRRNVARDGAREAERVGLSDQQIPDDPLADVESRVARRESAFGSHGIVGRLLEVIPDAAPNTASVLHSLFGPLGEDAVEKARREILERRDEIRSPAKYAVGIGKRLAAKQGAAA